MKILLLSGLVYKVAKFRCPKCEGVFTLSVAEVSKLLLEQPLKCLQGEHLIAFDSSVNT